MKLLIRDIQTVTHETTDRCSIFYVKYFMPLWFLFYKIICQNAQPHHDTKKIAETQVFLQLLKINNNTTQT
ncbi:unnamed protein product [Rotaria socialis]